MELWLWCYGGPKLSRTLSAIARRSHVVVDIYSSSELSRSQSHGGMGSHFSKCCRRALGVVARFELDLDTNSPGGHCQQSLDVLTWLWDIYSSSELSRSQSHSGMGSLFSECCRRALGIDEMRFVDLDFPVLLAAMVSIDLNCCICACVCVCVCPRRCVVVSCMCMPSREGSANEL